MGFPNGTVHAMEPEQCDACGRGGDEDALVVVLEELEFGVGADLEIHEGVTPDRLVVSDPCEVLRSLAKGHIGVCDQLTAGALDLGAAARRGEGLGLKQGSGGGAVGRLPGGQKA